MHRLPAQVLATRDSRDAGSSPATGVGRRGRHGATGFPTRSSCRGAPAAGGAIGTPVQPANFGTPVTGDSTPPSERHLDSVSWLGLIPTSARVHARPIVDSDAVDRPVTVPSVAARPPFSGGFTQIPSTTRRPSWTYCEKELSRGMCRNRQTCRPVREGEALPRGEATRRNRVRISVGPLRDRAADHRGTNQKPPPSRARRVRAPPALPNGARR